MTGPRRFIALVGVALALWMVTPTHAQQPGITPVRTVVTSTSTGTQNNFAPGLSGDTVLRMNNASLVTITGLTVGFSGQRVKIVSVGAGQVDLPHLSGSSTANFTNLVRAGTTSLKAGFGVADFVYDQSTLNWRMLSHDQGGSIDYSASSTVTGWTSFTTKKIFYELIGSRVYVDFDIEGTSNATTVSFTLPFTPSSVQLAFALGQTGDNGVSSASAGVCRSTVATINCFLDNAGTVWTNSGSKIVIGQFHYQVN